jgi:uncharacterized protein YbcV (DUF1398 family)
MPEIRHAMQIDAPREAVRSLVSGGSSSRCGGRRSQAAQKRALAVRPKAGGFPYLAEILRRAYDVDFTARRVAYYGCHGEEYVEDYPAVELE